MGDEVEHMLLRDEATSLHSTCARALQVRVYGHGCAVRGVADMLRSAFL